MSFSRSFVRKGAGAVLLAALCGCGGAPDDGIKELDLGKAAYEVRDLRKAEKLFEKSLSCAPDDVDRLLLLARVKLDLGDLAAAKGRVDRAAELAGGDTDVVLLRAQLAWHMKDYAAAAKGFSSLAENPKLEDEVRSQAQTGLGIVEMTCDNHHLARIAFLTAIRLDRRNAAAWYHLGLLYRDGFGYPEAALEQFEIFVRLEASASPRVQKVQRTIIPALKETIARTAASRPGVAKRDSAACAAKIAKAETEIKKGGFKAARSLYQDALKADPMSYPAALGLAKAWQKTDTSRAGQQKAFENYKLACMLRPGAISTFLSAGALATQLGFHAQAVEIYSRAVAASPTSLEAIDGLVRALTKVGKKAKICAAYNVYRKAVATKRKG